MVIPDVPYPSFQRLPPGAALRPRRAFGLRSSSSPLRAPMARRLWGDTGVTPRALQPQSQGNPRGFGTYLRSESSWISPQMTSLASAGPAAPVLLGEGTISSFSRCPNQEFGPKIVIFIPAGGFWIHPPFPWAVPCVDLACGVPWVLPSGVWKRLQGEKGAGAGAQGDGEGSLGPSWGGEGSLGSLGWGGVPQSQFGWGRVPGSHFGGEESLDPSLG